jgi:hypothetical protein
MSDDKMREYIRLRLEENCGHREASRRAGYKALASRRAVECFKFITETQPRPRSKDPQPEEVMQFLLSKLEILNAKVQKIREEVVDVKMKIRALNLMK